MEMVHVLEGSFEETCQELPKKLQLREQSA